MMRTLLTMSALSLAFFFNSISQAAPSDRSSRWGDQGGRPSWSAGDAIGSTPVGPRIYSDRDNRPKQKIRPFSPDSHNFSLSVGQVFLLGDLGQSYNDNLGGALNYTYGVSDIFGFHSSFGYSSHSDGAFSMTTLNAGLRMNLSWFDKIVPNLVFGLGFYKPSYSFGVTGEDSISPVLFGLDLGPGVDLELNDRVFFGTSLQFHSIFGTNKTTPSGKTIEAGGTFTAFLLHAGLTF